MNLPHITKEVLQKLYVEEGKSTKQVAEELGTSPQTICKRMKLYGIPGREFSTKGLQTRLGAVLSESTKEKIRSKHIGKKLSEEHRAKVVKTLLYGDKARGENNPSWNGGRSLSEEGYVLIRMPEHPNARSNGYFPEHRLVMEKFLGRLLRKEEHVHHKNEIKTDNRLENLEVLSNQEHMTEHWNDPERHKAQSEMMRRTRKEKFWSTRKKK